MRSYKSESTKSKAPVSRGPVANSNSLRIIAGGKTPPAERPIRAGGMAPPSDMPADQYVTLCEGAKVATMWGKPTAVVAFRVMEGKYSGVTLHGYFEIELDGEVTTAGCEYNKLCEIALGREIEPGDDLHPSRVFPAKMFEVSARFRKSSSGKRRQAEDPNVKKDPFDVLRVGAILRLVEAV